MSYRKLSEADLKGKRVLLRAGFDIPIEDRKVVDESRIKAMMPTMQAVVDAGGKLILLAHQGRPKGERKEEFSQKPLVPVIEKLLSKKVQFCDDWVGEKAKSAIEQLNDGDVLLLENVRFDPREKSKDKADREALGKELSELADVYVNDAFTNCHRDHASMTSVPQHLPSFLGLQLEAEIEGLSQVTKDPRRPLTLIVAGAKMETKVPVIEHFLGQGDDILLGGCIANTFIAARGFDVGTSKFEPDQIEKAQEIMLLSEKEKNAMVHVPRDAVLASAPSEDAEKVDLPVEDIEGDMAIFDIGKVTIDRYTEIIEKSGMIIWNGPVGLYEMNRFSHASKRLVEAIAKATRENGAISILGGGDTVDFHVRYGYSLDDYSFVSTGGGAMLEFISGKKLPALKALRD